MTLHYQDFIRKLRSCPVTVGFGPSGTGKTTALHSGLSVLGADGFRCFHQLSSAKALQLCSVTNIPLGLDDPDSKSNFLWASCSTIMGPPKLQCHLGKLNLFPVLLCRQNLHHMKTKGILHSLIDYYILTEISTCRHASRCLLIEFQEPPITIKTSQHMQLVQLWDMDVVLVLVFESGWGQDFFVLAIKR